MRKVNFNNVIESPPEKLFYKKVLVKIMNYLQNNGSAKFSEIVKFVEGGDRRTLRLLNEMVTTGLIKFKKDHFYLAKDKLCKLSSRDVGCPKCQGKIINIDNKRLSKVKKIMKRIYRSRPSPTFIFDQRPATSETTIRRALYLVWRGDIQAQKVVLIGDDDLTSLVLGFLNLAQEIVVFEVDKRLIHFLKKQARKYHLRIKVVERDILSGVPIKYQNKFDVFLADPTPTPAPFTAFVNAGIRLLKRGEGRIGYLSFLPSCMDKSIALQRILTQMNFIITDLIPFFTEYEVIKKIYSNQDLKLLKKYSKNDLKTAFYEHLVRVETTDKTKIRPLRIKLKNILGRATKRVLQDLTKDPAVSSGQTIKKYLIQAAHKLIKNKNKKLKL